MRLARRPQPFDHPGWLYEIKFDGFRALAYVEAGKCRLVSRRRHEYKSFRELCGSIANHPRGHEAVIDGEIVCLDQYGRSQFYALMFRRGQPFFYAFDLLWLNGEDLRTLPLIERKARLRKLIRRGWSRLLYVDHLEREGCELFKRICELDLEGIVAKRANSMYRATEQPSPDWIKIKNPNYSQKEGRAELFDELQGRAAAKAAK